MEGSNHNRISKLLMNLLNPYAYTFHTCSYKALESFLVKDFYLKENELPVVLPFGEYRLHRF